MSGIPTITIIQEELKRQSIYRVINKYLERGKTKGELK